MRRLVDLVPHLEELRGIRLLEVEEDAAELGAVGIGNLEGLEEIVGEIEDETDAHESDPIEKIAEDLYSVAAITDIELFNEFFDVGLSDDECDTVGGLVVGAFGRLPEIGESIALDDFEFTVSAADRRKIIAVDVRKQTR